MGLSQSWQGVPMHQLALVSIMVYSALHAYFSQSVVAGRINQKDQ